MGVIQGYVKMAGLFEIFNNTKKNYQNLSKLTVLYISKLQLDRMKGIYQFSCKKYAKIRKRNCQRIRFIL